MLDRTQALASYLKSVFETQSTSEQKATRIADAIDKYNLNPSPTAQVAPNFISTASSPTQPYACTSIALNSNLNADLLDGFHASAFLQVEVDPYYTASAVARHEPTGFEDREAELSFDPINYRLTITGDHTIWIDGESFEKTTDTVDLPNTPPDPPESGLWYIYYDLMAELTASKGFPGFDYPLLATVYWNSNTSQYTLCSERHGIVMGWSTHQYLHKTVGMRYSHGLTLGGYILGTDSDAGVQVSVTGGTAFDEDLQIDVVDDPTPESPFEQDLSKPAKIPIFYRGVDGLWEKDTATSFCFKNTLAGRVNYNVAGVPDWTQAEIGDNYHAAVWIFATTNYYNPIIAIQGQRQDSKLVDAKTNNTYEALVCGDLPCMEMKLLYRVILNSKSTYGGERLAKIVDVLDYRSVSSLPGVYIPTSHASLSDRSAADSHPATAISVDIATFDEILTAADDTVQKALDTLDAGLAYYAKLPGRDLGQDIYGGTATGKDLRLFSNTVNDGRIYLGTSYYDESAARLSLAGDLEFTGASPQIRQSGGNAVLSLNTYGYATGTATGIFNTSETAIVLRFKPQFNKASGSSTTILDSTGAAYRIALTPGGNLVVRAGSSDLIFTIAYATWGPAWNDLDWNLMVILLTDAGGASSVVLNGSTIATGGAAFTKSDPAALLIGISAGLIQLFHGLFDYVYAYSDVAMTTPTAKYDFAGNYESSISHTNDLAAAGAGNQFISLNPQRMTVNYHGTFYSELLPWDVTTDFAFLTKCSRRAGALFNVSNNGDNKLTVSYNGLVQMPGQGAATGVIIGGDFQIYRSAANVGTIPVSSKLTVGTLVAYDDFTVRYVALGGTGIGMFRHDGDVDNNAMWLNKVGYLAGVTRYRDLKIGDGKGGTMAFFDGSENTTTYYGTVILDAANKLLCRDSTLGVCSQTDGSLDFFADVSIRFGDSVSAAPTNYAAISATGDLSFAGSAGFYLRRVSQADIPAAGTGATQIDTGELMIWRDSDDAKIYLVYNDADSGIKSVEMI